MSNVSSPDKKSGCGLLNVVFGSRTFWPRRIASTGSLRELDGTGNNIDCPKKIRSAGHNSKNRRGSFDDLQHTNLPSLGGSKLQPKISPAKQQQTYRGTKASMNVTTVMKQNHGQNTRKTVPKEKPGISGELEMMIAEHQSTRKGTANLVRASSGNVMVHSSLGNLRLSGGTNFTDTNPASHTRQEHQVSNKDNNYPSQYANTGAGNIVNRKTPPQNGALSCRMDPEELKVMGNEDYKNGRFAEALALYERAIELDPAQASYRSNKSAALIALGRLLEAVFECREAISIDPQYHRAHRRLACLYLRLGEAEKAVHHFRQAAQEADQDKTRKAKAVIGYLKKCDDAKRLNDWQTVLRESDNAICAGADSAQWLIIALQAESYIKLHQHQDADIRLKNSPNFNVDQCTKFFGPARNATLLLIRAQVDIVAGRFDDAVQAVQQAGKLDPSNKDLCVITKRAQAVSAARTHGNNLFKEARFSEAFVAYSQGLEHEPYNSVLLCNRAACRTKLDQFEKAVDDCTAALKVRPSFSKARQRRAECNAKMRNWEAAVSDYEILLKESLGDDDVRKAVFEAQVNLKKQRGEDVLTMVHNMV